MRFINSMTKRPRRALHDNTMSEGTLIGMGGQND